MKKLIILSAVLGLFSANAFAVSPDALKASVDAIVENKSLSDIDAVKETSVAFCRDCFTLEFKGSRPGASDHDSVVTVSTKFNESTKKIDALILGGSF